MPTPRKCPVQFAEVDPKVIEQEARHARELVAAFGLSTWRDCLVKKREVIASAPYPPYRVRVDAS